MMKQKWAIIFDALSLGVPIRYSADWDILFDPKTNKLYEIFFQRPQGEDVSRKSTITLNEFLSHYQNISDAELKTIYGNIRLFRLQKRLIEENK
jgi:hypothetical protein